MFIVIWHTRWQGILQYFSVGFPSFWRCELLTLEAPTVSRHLTPLFLILPLQPIVLSLRYASDWLMES